MDCGMSLVSHVQSLFVGRLVVSSLQDHVQVVLAALRQSRSKVVPDFLPSRVPGDMNPRLMNWKRVTKTSMLGSRNEFDQSTQLSRGDESV